MKILSKDITKDEGGRVALQTQEAEDLWHAYNLILPGDHVTTKTYRRVIKETSSGSTEGERKAIKLSICVKKLDYDPMDNLLRLSGKVSSENQYVKMGSFHTLEIGLFKDFSLWKHEWDDVTLMRLEEATSDKVRAVAGAVVMQEGVANVCIMTESMTLTKAHITQAIPRKRKTSAGAHDKSIDKFYQVVYDAMLRNFDFNNMKAIIIASPGFVKDQFFAYLTQMSIRTDNKEIIENKSKFLLVHANSGHRHSLTEVLKDKAVLARLSDTKAAGEVAVLQKFYETMKKDPNQAVYSRKHVQLACESGAIEDLLLSDNLFRSKNLDLRREYIQLVENVKAVGGNVHIFSSLHVSGEQLAQLSGVAAVLRFPMPQLDDEVEEEEAEEAVDADEQKFTDDPEEHPFGGSVIEVEYNDEEDE